MHEAGIIIHILEKVKTVAQENNMERVDELVLEIGELSGVVPHYIEDCYQIMTSGTPFEATRLRIEMVPGMGECKTCGYLFHISSHGGKCPRCSAEQIHTLSGTGFIIKEILAYGPPLPV